MNVFAPGQRWISDTEPDLGLGTVVEENPRHVTVVFLASGDTRIYAKETAPLTRIRFAVGDNIITQDDQHLRVVHIDEAAGCLSYAVVPPESPEVAPRIITENELNNFLKFNRPQDRLFAGQIDNRRWFNLRTDVYRYRHERRQSAIRGLAGARVSIIPHQIYIASEVSRRLAPRVLLADEVGLGKTIEAGLILHSQHVNHLVDRALIVVPETLLHQWLVEMLRKFNLQFHIVDEERFDALLPSAPDGNPFLAEQFNLCALETLLHRPEIATAATAGEWHMLVVDEAHHLDWSHDGASAAYTLIEPIARSTAAVLLLTATPEQLGPTGHFARLRLLDPDRFSDYGQFVRDAADFPRTAALANALLSEEPLTSTDIDALLDILPDSAGDTDKELLALPATHDMIGLRERLLEELIDRHGTGRVLFRNTRHTITGFPERQLVRHHLEPQPTAADYARWLSLLLKAVYPDKVLVICAQRETILQMSGWLRNAGINSALFHEGMTIVERDRAAAWFAEESEACQVLLCSEIGSEGRNFQFLHHLVTFELPANPDVLEQRIGRLDRIGQQQDIEIHVPVCEGSRDEYLLRWYDDGLDAFENICQVGPTIAAELEHELQVVLSGDDVEALNALITRTRYLADKYSLSLEQGRDRLLELHSNRVDRVAEQLDQLSREDRSYALSDFMARIFDSFGVDNEEQSDQSVIIRPSDNMQVVHFPGLDADGLTITYRRDVALAREDYAFLSWDHPMVTAALDLVLNESFGQANAEIINTDLLPRGVLYLEAAVTWSCSAERTLNIERYFPAATRRYLLGSNRKDYTQALPRLNIDTLLIRSDRSRLRQALRQGRRDIDVLIQYCEKLSKQAIPEIVATVRNAVDLEHETEITRLEALQRINPLVRPDEIERLRQRQIQLHRALTQTRAELVAVSVLLNP